uniref:Uncharacterized protein n=1 Tax=Rubinisphaera brasiliensis (strain ATCC 49424 / DSM 5305 / JCM 21570 / IAM 15109 / NBRC 103401 / IFAM 1448) TaxID=756272 RepID=F0SHI5_RUBBR|nr:hypothetical protein Plabr_0800 [Rubinisphaera brasiliensis DSM 5305]
MCRSFSVFEGKSLLQSQDKPLATASPGLTSPGQPCYLSSHLLLCVLWASVVSFLPKLRGNVWGLAALDHQPPRVLLQGWSVHSCADAAGIRGFSCGFQIPQAFVCRSFSVFEGKSLLQSQDKPLATASPGLTSPGQPCYLSSHLFLCALCALWASVVFSLPKLRGNIWGLAALDRQPRLVLLTRMVRTFMCGCRRHKRLLLWFPNSPGYRVPILLCTRRQVVAAITRQASCDFVARTHESGPALLFEFPSSPLCPLGLCGFLPSQTAWKCLGARCARPPATPCAGASSFNVNGIRGPVVHKIQAGLDICVGLFHNGWSHKFSDLDHFFRHG